MNLEKIDMQPQTIQCRMCGADDEFRWGIPIDDHTALIASAESANSSGGIAVCRVCYARHREGAFVGQEVGELRDALKGGPADWISVDDQLPEPFVRVLVFDKAIPRFQSQRFGVRSHNQKVIGYRYDTPSLDGRRWFVPDGLEPSHWMPLPADPIEQPPRTASQGESEQ